MLFSPLHRYPGTVTKVLNLGSYNYLGFAETSGPCIEDVVQKINDDGVGSCSCRNDLGIVQSEGKISINTVHIFHEIEYFCYCRSQV